ncbi:capsule biosynthesis protein [Pseudoroseicyclus tamaricis]|uniref:Capsule biosynthesis protein n=1 Tax=Pseudoroseicyclus tamaricis TaxID=2705421 RepID=A0A6B2JLE1_9RHOB|nr:capsule biosynthesis protein [Pseudoroseicyclus tamaricis]NDV02371.1 capsule biosynthesis protein [Pseudoroseicyclus tamaricis]
MTTKPKVRKFRLRRAAPLTIGSTALSTEVTTQAPAPSSAAEAIDAIRAEGLTGRQLRMARRVAQKHGLAVTSDFDAVRQLRAKGIDPFQRSNILELVVPGESEAGEEPAAAPEEAAPEPAPEALPATTPRKGGELKAKARVQLPQTVPERKTLPSTERVEPKKTAAAAGFAEVQQIQRDMARRRRRRMVLLTLRLAVLVALPTLLAGIYFTRIATPMYATHSEFVIQQAEPASAGAGLGGLLQGTSMATQQDSITVQSYLSSRAAFRRLNEEHDFRDIYSAPAIDAIQRLDPEATNEEAYRTYQDHVKISYDPTEGIVKMEVIAPDPAVSQNFSEALIDYAEEQVDQLTSRLRADSMAGAQEAYEQAEARRATALEDWLTIQEAAQQIDPIGETAARTQQISQLETQRQQLQLELQTRLNVARPNAAQVEALQGQIAGIEELIAGLRSEMTDEATQGGSLAARNTELRTAEENYTFQTLMVQQALQAMEVARQEANRQVRYLSLGVEPVAPDEPSYPRAFENTLLAFLLFAGIYLMISLTASILREQIAS